MTRAKIDGSKLHIPCEVIEKQIAQHLEEIVIPSNLLPSVRKLYRQHIAEINGPDRDEEIARLKRQISLLQAEEFVNKHPEETKVILQNYQIGEEPDDTKPGINRVTLNRPLLLDMEDRTRWILSQMNNGSVKVPVLWKYINFELLKKVDPKRVTVIH